MASFSIIVPQNIFDIGGLIPQYLHLRYWGEVPPIEIWEVSLCSLPVENLNMFPLYKKLSTTKKICPAKLSKQRILLTNFPKILIKQQDASFPFLRWQSVNYANFERMCPKLAENWHNTPGKPNRKRKRMEKHYVTLKELKYLIPKGPLEFIFFFLKFWQGRFLCKIFGTERFRAILPFRFESLIWIESFNDGEFSPLVFGQINYQFEIGLCNTETLKLNSFKNKC